ncbi:O-antigen ligase family protein [Micromonospora haikouensis]|uniref:O-antigen ligase family protein n=1 Tax=Micromonospora haikouensis TaxID=686309 RepID=UPI003789EA9C
MNSTATTSPAARETMATDPAGPHHRHRPWQQLPPRAETATLALVRALRLAGVAVLCFFAYRTAADPWWAMAHSDLAALLTLVLAARRPRPLAPDVLAVGTGVWAFATVLWSVRPDLSIPSAYLYLSVFAFFLGIRQLVTTWRRLAAVGYAFLAGCLMTVGELYSKAAPTLASSGRVVDVRTRFTVSAADVNFTAYTLVTGLVVALVLTVATAGHAPRVVRWLTLATVAPLFWGVLLSGSRGAAIGASLALAAFVVSRLGPRWSWRGVAVAAPVVIVVVSLGWVPHSQIARLELGGLYHRSTGDLSGRLDIWPYAASNWADALFTGHGAGVFFKTNPFGIGAHNLLLTLGNDVGLIGALLYLGVIASALWLAARGSLPALRLAPVFVVALLPIWLTGEWMCSMATLLTLALLSKLPRSAAAPAGGPTRRAPAVQAVPAGARTGSGRDAPLAARLMTSANAAAVRAR